MDTSEHRIHVLVRADESGHGQWMGVGVCDRCPADGVRRTFSVGEPCPVCGAEGALEWRRTFFELPSLAGRAGQP